MKTLLKFSGIISAVLAIVAFILLLATPGVTITAKENIFGSKDTSTVAGTFCIFGGKEKINEYLSINYAATWAGVLAFILILVALVILICAIILPLLKVKALDKFAGVLNLVAVISLILAGVFAFCIVAAFKAANKVKDASNFLGSSTYGIGAGWVVVGIIAIVAGVFAVLPAASDFISKK